MIYVSVNFTAITFVSVEYGLANVASWTRPHPTFGFGLKLTLPNVKYIQVVPFKSLFDTGKSQEFVVKNVRLTFRLTS